MRPSKRFLCLCSSTCSQHCSLGRIPYLFFYFRYIWCSWEEDEAYTHSARKIIIHFNMNESRQVKVIAVARDTPLKNIIRIWITKCPSLSLSFYLSRSSVVSGSSWRAFCVSHKYNNHCCAVPQCKCPLLLPKQSTGITQNECISCLFFVTNDWGKHTEWKQNRNEWYKKEPFKITTNKRPSSTAEQQQQQRE